MSKPSAKDIILRYIDEADKGISLKNGRVAHSCHTVYYRPTVDGKKLKCLNDTLRDLGYDPIAETQKLIKAGLIYGSPRKGGFAISRVRESHGERKSVTNNMALLDKFLGSTEPNTEKE